MKIPVKTKCLYLGTIMSYDAFEMQTLRLRVAVGWKHFRRLQPWLCGRKRVAYSLRQRIMNTCIIPCLTYGLLYVGITTPGLKILHAQMTKMLRRITGNMAHVTGLNNIDFFHNYQLRDPVAIVWNLLQQAFQAFRMRFRKTLEDFDYTLQRVPAEPQVLTCQDFGANFTHPNLLQKHMTIQHQKPRQVEHRLNMLRDSKGGKAICQHCGKCFSNWASFKFHTKHNICRPRLTPLDMNQTQVMVRTPFLLYHKMHKQSLTVLML